MSAAASSTATGLRDYVIELEASKSWGRKGALDLLRLSAMGASITHDRALHTPLRVPLGTLQLGLVDPGPARPSGDERPLPDPQAPQRDRCGAARAGHRGLAVDEPRRFGADRARRSRGRARTPRCCSPSRSGDDAVECFAPEIARRRSPPARRSARPPIYGLLFRVDDTSKAETVFRQFGLLRPLTDREVPPTLRRSLPTDRPADPSFAVSGDDPRASTSVAPPGLG